MMELGDKDFQRKILEVYSMCLRKSMKNTHHEIIDI